MRLRVLELPARPIRERVGDEEPVYAVGQPVYVLVFDEVSPDEADTINGFDVDKWQTAAGARGALVFRGRVDLPSAD